MIRFKNWHRRLIIISLSLLCIGTGLLFLLKAVRDNIIFFVTPTELTQQLEKYNNKIIRLGGIVKNYSVKKSNHKSLDNLIEFTITDLKNEIIVMYDGAIPGLFKEGSGAIVQGKIQGNIFQAKELLAKHDENYMPKEVVDSLKSSGTWKGQQP